MHKEILDERQDALLDLAEMFCPPFGLVGGTAIALQIGHRRSIDFDMFSKEEFKNEKIKKKITKAGFSIKNVFKDEKGQYTFHINGVQFTFYEYPYTLKFTEKISGKLKTPDLLSLAAMKAFALGRRNKWKDYVDLYFILSGHHTISDIVNRGKKIFEDEFNENIFRKALAYFDDINYAEEIEFMPGFSVSDKVVKKALIKHAIS